MSSLPHRSLASDFTETALVKVLGFPKQTMKGCFQFDSFTWGTWHSWPLLPLNCLQPLRQHVVPLCISLTPTLFFFLFHFSVHSSNLHISQKGLTLATFAGPWPGVLSLVILLPNPQSMCFLPMGWLQEWAGDLRWAHYSIEFPQPQPSIIHGWTNSPRAVNAKQDQVIFWTVGF